MKKRTVSLVFHLPTALRKTQRVSVKLVAEIKRAQASTRPLEIVAVKPTEDDRRPEYLSWNGRVVKRSVPFLCMGDN